VIVDLMAYLVCPVQPVSQARKVSLDRPVQPDHKVLSVLKVIEVILVLHLHQDKKETPVYQVRLFFV
jgi:hypothetical protein